MISIESTRTMSPSEACNPLANEVRDCGDCSTGRLRCKKVVEERKNGFYMGRTYEYGCDTCGASLDQLDGWMAFKRFGMETLGALVVGGLFMAIGVAGSVGNPWMLGIGLLGLLVFASGSFSAFTLKRHRSLLARTPLL